MFIKMNIIFLIQPTLFCMSYLIQIQKVWLQD